MVIHTIQFKSITFWPNVQGRHVCIFGRLITVSRLILTYQIALRRRSCSCKEIAMALLQENKRVKVKTSCSGQSVSFPFKAALQRLLKDVVLVVVVSELFKPHAVSLDMLEQQGAEKFDTQIACPCNSQKSIAGPSGPLSHCCMSWWICIDSRGQQSQAHLNI